MKLVMRMGLWTQSVPQTQNLLDALTVSPGTIWHYMNGILMQGPLKDVADETITWVETHLQH